jgi:hypothetical protein
MASVLRWVLRAPFLFVLGLLLLIVSPILLYEWLEDKYEPWDWLWEKGRYQRSPDPPSATQEKKG